MRFSNRLIMRCVHTLTWLTQRATMGAQIAVTDGPNILLVRHVYKPGWHLPGGGIDPPEPPEVAATRELMEETGYAVISSPRLLGVFSNATPATKRDYVTIFTASDFVVPSDQLRKSPEIAELGWFPISQLPEDADQMCRSAVEVLLGKG